MLAAVLFHMLIGFAEDNWWYLGMGIFFCAVGAVAVAYLIMVAVTKLKYSAMIRRQCIQAARNYPFRNERQLHRNLLHVYCDKEKSAACMDTEVVV